MLDVHVTAFGTTHLKWNAYINNNYPSLQLKFACSPENLRLGQVIKVFSDPDRVIIGVRAESTKITLRELLCPITDKIEWMSIESAEMTKHAINAFLGTSITFTNEVASICEQVGASAREVERGLKTEVRIGPKAYVSPGGPFAGWWWTRWSRWNALVRYYIWRCGLIV